MLRKYSPFILFFCVLGLHLAADAQLKKDIVAERAQWEQFLKKAKIVKSEDLSEGITKPKKLTLEKDGKKAMAVWKHPWGTGAGKSDKWEWEIAVYRLDKLLGLNMVPPTVKKRFRGWEGSCQLWVDFVISEGERLSRNIEIPKDKQEDFIKAISLQRAFDSLIANSDRNQQNLRYTNGWRIVLIDHSRSFRSNELYGHKLLYGRNGVRKEKPIFKLPRQFVKKLKNMTAKNVRDAVESYMAFWEIKDMFERRDLLVEEIEALIAEKGETNVLY